MLLHTEAFTHSTQKLCTHRKNRNFTAVFGDRPSFRAKGLQQERLELALLLQLLAIEPHFVRKGCNGQREPGNRNIISVFGDRTSFRSKGLRGTT